MDETMDTKSLWRAKRSTTAGRVSFGPTFGDAYYIKVVFSSQFILHATLLGTH